MTKQTEILIDGLTFTEGPRWHENRLYFSDFFTHQVIAVDTKGHKENIIETPYQPSGLGWMPDGTMLIVSMNDRKLMKFSNRVLSEAADLSVIKEGYAPVPDGICLDTEGAIWVASPTTNDVIRVQEGGILLDKIELSNSAFACMLGGEEGNTLFISTAKDSQKENCLKEKSARIETIKVDVPRAGLP